MLGICPWTDWQVNLTAWLQICDGNSIASMARRFMFALILATFTPAASLPWVWWPSRFTMTSFTSVWSRQRQLRITHLQNFFLLSAEKAWKVNMNPASRSFFLPREVSVLSMTQIWRTGLRMCCSGLYTEGRNIKRSWKGVGIGVRGGGVGESSRPPDLKNFRASASCSKILNGTNYFITVQNSRAPSVFQGKRKLFKILNDE